MSRKFNLIKESDQLLRFARCGKQQTRNNRRQEVRRLINDLVQLGIAPRSLNELRDQHFFSLISYWQQKELTIRTITNKIGTLRTFFKLTSEQISIPSNKLLDLSSAGEGKVKAPNNINELEDALTKVQHSFTRSIIAFQLYFGLTKMESIRINIHLAKSDGYLLIDRALASNGKDRYIPILDINQEQALKGRTSLLAEKESLISVISEFDLNALYKADLIISKLDPKIPYRQHYAQKRYQALITTLPFQKTIKQLQSELGISSQYRLQELL